MHIGTTDTVQGIYQLLAVLRLLAEWVDTTFRVWVGNVFCPRSDMFGGTQDAASTIEKAVLE